MAWSKQDVTVGQLISQWKLSDWLLKRTYAVYRDNDYKFLVIFETIPLQAQAEDNKTRRLISIQ